MKIDIYLVKDEYSTVANFRSYEKAIECSLSNSDYTIERIEIELPKYKEFRKEFIEDDISLNTESNSLESIINNHCLKVYIENDRNKMKTAKVLGITVKTLYNRFDKMGIK